MFRLVLRYKGCNFYHCLRTTAMLDAVGAQFSALIGQQVLINILSLISYRFYCNDIHRDLNIYIDTLSSFRVKGPKSGSLVLGFTLTTS